LPLIEGDLLEIFFNIADAVISSIKISSKAACCIVNAAPGYPEKPVKNIILGLPKSNEDCYILHAGTSKNEENIVSSGGRVLNVVALADSMTDAISNAYALNEKIEFPQRQFRTDIGKYFPKNNT
jgi:phosphoribosylamine--glycine ligase